MWVLLGEMFPNRLRGAALAVSGATNWVTNFAVTVTFLPLLNAAGLGGAYTLYAIAAAISIPLCGCRGGDKRQDTRTDVGDTTNVNLFFGTKEGTQG